MTLTLVQTPNQMLPFYYDTNLYELNLRIFENVLYASVKVNDEQVVASRRVFGESEIFGGEHLQKMYGSLVMHTKYDASVTDYSNYNEAVYLEFIPPDS